MIRNVMLNTLLALALFSLSGCNNDNRYTLYRASPLDQAMRIHMATFDAADGEAYNQENCQIVANLMKNQPGVTVNYWCEKGPFRE